MNLLETKYFIKLSITFVKHSDTFLLFSHRDRTNFRNGKPIRTYRLFENDYIFQAQTLAQMNAKLEAEILNVREDLFSQIAEMKSSKDENEKLILEFHKEKVVFLIFLKFKLYLQLNNLKAAGMDITDVESKMQAEIDEWRTDRNQLHNALEKETQTQLILSF